MTTWNRTARFDCMVRRMADKRVDLDKLADSIAMTLEEYHKKVDTDVYKVGSKAIKELETRTVDTAPMRYRAKFRDHIASRSSQDRLHRSEHLWYVKAPEHRLTHLLVHGHKIKNTGRSTKPNRFLENALNRVLKKYEKEVEEAVKRG